MKILLILSFILLLTACKKERQLQPQPPPVCGHVFDRFYITWPPDTIRTYFFKAMIYNINQDPFDPNDDSMAVNTTAISKALYDSFPNGQQYCW